MFLQACGGKMQEKDWNALIQKIGHVSKTEEKKKKEVKVQKGARAFDRNPLKAQIDEGLDDFDEFDDFR